MNIVKFKDIITENSFYDENLKGKYALTVNFLYIFPLDIEDLTDKIQNIVLLERERISESSNELNFSINEKEFHMVRDTDYVLYTEFESYIENFGELDKYISFNKFTPDSDITIDKLKKFRTWLAEILMENEVWIDSWSKDPDKHKNMLSYYAQEMYDDVVKALSSFSSYVDLNSITMQSGCGCGNHTLVGVSQTQNVVICDPLLIYRHNIYKYMVEVFSDLTYWMGQVEICEEMQKYIDNIIRLNFPLSSTTLYSNFADCTCLNSNTSEQETLMNILKRLSVALGFIIKNEVSSNRNYISSALLDWSTYLYEKMRW